MNRNFLETVMGAVVIVVAVIFLLFAYHSAELRSVSGYTLSAKFDHIDGVREGADVRLSGIKIGSIIATSLDPKTFQAVVKLSVDDTIKLPVDTIATITQNGLLGDQYMSLVPGNSDKTVAPGGELSYTQSAPSLMALFGQAVFSMSGGNKPADGGGSAAPSQGSQGAAPSNLVPKFDGGTPQQPN
jgi:phospholipid/cholesterol/gamma-HCH transport system substrate-binding protein